MKYVLTPLNEGQEMNCRVKFSGNKANAIKNAIGIAAGLQAHLGANTITCRVQRAGTESETPTKRGASIIATPIGKALDEVTGDEIEL